jgi:hypothetical protein
LLKESDVKARKECGKYPIENGDARDCKLALFSSCIFEFHSPFFHEKNGIYGISQCFHLHFLLIQMDSGYVAHEAANHHFAWR